MDDAIWPNTPRSFKKMLRDHGLSEREVQVVQLAAIGMTAKEIAPILGISSSTVASHRQRAYVKLGISKVAELRAIATGYGTSNSPLDEALKALTPLPGSAERGAPLTLFCVGSAVLIASLFLLLAASRHAESQGTLLYIAIFLIVLASAMLLTGEAIYLRRRTRAQQTCSNYLRASAEFEKVSDCHLSSLGMNATERAALVRIAQGSSAADICQELSIARGTLNSIRARGYAKLGVKSAVQLAKLLLIASSSCDDENAREAQRASDIACSKPDALADYNKETARIIDAAQGMGFAYAGMGLGILVLVVLCILFTVLSEGAIR